MKFSLFLIFIFLSITPSAYSLSPLEDSYLDVPLSLEEQIVLLEENLSLKSCASILQGLAYLGQKNTFFGSVIPEDSQFYYLKSLRSKELNFTAQGESLCLMTSLKNISNKNVSRLDPNFFKGLDLFFIHPVQFQNIAVLRSCLEFAKKNSVKISCDLADVSFVKKYKNELLNLIPEYIDLLFANEKEILELTALPPHQACDYLANLCDIVVVTMGYSGSWVKSGKTKFYTPSFKTNEILNAGVGDCFISGFLHAYLQKASLHECAWFASYVASKALENRDKNLTHFFWSEIIKTLDAESSVCFFNQK